MKDRIRRELREVFFAVLVLIFFFASLIIISPVTANAAKTVVKKVTICHIQPGNSKYYQTLSVDENAVGAHRNHGDFLGTCDSDGDGVVDIYDKCTKDPKKKAPDVCGCGVADTDTDKDGTPDCKDMCKTDAKKTKAGMCGCGKADIDTDRDGTPDCKDACPTDFNKTRKGTCGCGVADKDSDKDGRLDCKDMCPIDPKKKAPGVCGCGVADTDTDKDGVPDCNDKCPKDAKKTEAGINGCGVADTKKVTICHVPPGNPKNAQTILVDENAVAAHRNHGDFLGSCDSDGDGVIDLYDNCSSDPKKTEPGICGCGAADTDSDGDRTADCNDKCPIDSLKTAPGICGCGVNDRDSDGDGTADCKDACPSDKNKTIAGSCGCGAVDTDSDNDGSADCSDKCECDPNKTVPGICGCGMADTDSDKNGTADCNEGGRYYKGYIWKLVNDYTPGTARYSTLGNPDNDANGVPAWSYEWINTSGLGIDVPWYTSRSTLLTWDSFDYNRNFWATNDGGVNLNKYVVNYSLSNNGIGKAPLVRWTNPTGRSVRVNIYGRFRLNWYGLNVNPNWRTDGNYWTSYLAGSPADVNIAVGYYDVSAKSTSTLLSQKVSKPINGETTCVAPNYDACDHEFVYVNSDVIVDPGDSIFWTARPLKYYSDRNRWITMDHGDITIRIVPDPVVSVCGAFIDENMFYAAEPSANIERLVSIDPVTLEVETVLNLRGRIGFMSNTIAFSPDGELFGWDNTWQQLYRIDLSTGEVVHIGKPAGIGINGMSFDMEGNLYGLNVANDTLASINVSTGAVTVIGPLGLDIKHNGMGVDFRTGELYGVSGLDADSLFKIDKTTGHAQVIGPLGVTYPDVAIEFSPVTGELFAIRNQNIMMKIDRENGRATEVGVIEGFRSTNMAAPWPAPGQ